jgi:hypothetical protein
MKYKIAESSTYPDVWHAEAFDDERRCLMAVFSGPGANQRGKTAEAREANDLAIDRSNGWSERFGERARVENILRLRENPHIETMERATLLARLVTS